ncbi:MAG: aminotransferase class V-fold PLP-dependent enzyme [Clostridia bacterium]|nr:aminotransferase class V-fold PLP-dependent enzyme [Clostridia bacterium]
MIYFDNAATGGYKPIKVTESVLNAVKFLNANAGRSGHRLSLQAAEIVYETRKILSRLFSVGSPERVVFTYNCTDALNKVILGSVREKCGVITTVTEHNSVLRPLYFLRNKGLIDLTVVQPKGSAISASDIESTIDENTKMVVLNAVSNVTGAENDIEGVGKLLEKKNILFIVDGAQAAGHKRISLKENGIDALCVAGHKGLAAIQGAGALMLGEKIKVAPTVFGGTGMDSFNENMPDNYPERLEAGTVALPAISSLKAGAEYVFKNLPYISSKIFSLTEFLIENLAIRPYLRLYSIPNPCGIVAFSHAEIPSQKLSEILSDNYDVAVRGGYHCAPLMHRFLKTEKFGLVRCSLSENNTKREISAFIRALDEISNF